MKIAIYSICKNEEENVKDFIETVKQFDEVVVVDTGSTDNTIKLLEEAGIKVHQLNMPVEEFDFSIARSYSKSLLSKDVDWCGFLDFNERFENYNALWFNDLDATSVIFERYDDFGNGDIKRGLEDHIRFIKPELYEWRNAVHEDVFPVTEKHKTVTLPIKIIKKIIRREIKEEFYVDICKRELKKNPSQTFYHWFVIKNYYTKRDEDNVIKYGMEYLARTENLTGQFRPMVASMCAIAAVQKQNIPMVISLSYLILSEIYIMMGQVPPEIIQQLIGDIFRISETINYPELALVASSIVMNKSDDFKEMRKNIIEKINENGVKFYEQNA